MCCETYLRELPFYIFAHTLFIDVLAMYLFLYMSYDRYARSDLLSFMMKREEKRTSRYRRFTEWVGFPKRNSAKRALF